VSHDRDVGNHDHRSGEQDFWKKVLVGGGRNRPLMTAGDRRMPFVMARKWHGPMSVVAPAGDVRASLVAGRTRWDRRAGVLVRQSY
jgi:hypothetical protein